MATANEISAQFQAQNAAFLTSTQLSQGQMAPPGFSRTPGPTSISAPATAPSFSSPLPLVPGTWFPQAAGPATVQFPTAMSAIAAFAGIAPQGREGGWSAYSYGANYQAAAAQSLSGSVGAGAAGLVAYGAIPAAAVGLEIGAFSLGSALAGGSGLSAWAGRTLEAFFNPFAWGRAGRAIGQGMASGVGPGAGMLARGAAALAPGLGWLGGAATGLLPSMALYGIADWTANAMMSGVETRSQVMDIFGSIAPGMGAVGTHATGIGGRGFSRGFAGEVSREIGSMAARDPMLDVQDLTRLLEAGGANQLLRGTTNITEFRRKFSDLVAQVKEISLALSSSVEESTAFMAAMRGTGYTGGYTQLAANVRTMANLGGTSTGDVTNAFVTGSQMGRQYGVFGPGPGRVFAEQSTLFNYAQNAPGMPEGAKVRMENVFGGPEGYAGRQVQFGAGFGRGANIGRMLLIAAQKADGTLNQELIEDVAKGNVSIERLQQLSTNVMQGKGRAAAMADIDRTREAIMETGLMPYVGMGLGVTVGQHLGSIGESSDPAYAMSVIFDIPIEEARAQYAMVPADVAMRREAPMVAARQRMEAERARAATTRGVGAWWRQGPGMALAGAAQAVGAATMRGIVEPTERKWMNTLARLGGTAEFNIGAGELEAAASALAAGTAAPGGGPTKEPLFSPGYQTSAELFRKLSGATGFADIAASMRPGGGGTAFIGQSGFAWGGDVAAAYARRTAAYSSGEILDADARQIVEAHRSNIESRILGLKPNAGWTAAVTTVKEFLRGHGIDDEERLEEAANEAVYKLTLGSGGKKGLAKHLGVAAEDVPLGQASAVNDRLVRAQGEIAQLATGPGNFRRRLAQFEVWRSPSDVGRQMQSISLENTAAKLIRHFESSAGVDQRAAFIRYLDDPSSGNRQALLGNLLESEQFSATEAQAAMELAGTTGIDTRDPRSKAVSRLQAYRGTVEGRAQDAVIKLLTGNAVNLGTALTQLQVGLAEAGMGGQVDPVTGAYRAIMGAGSMPREQAGAPLRAGFTALQDVYRTLQEKGKGDVLASSVLAQQLALNPDVLRGGYGAWTGQVDRMAGTMSVAAGVVPPPPTGTEPGAVAPGDAASAEMQRRQNIDFQIAQILERLLAKLPDGGSDEVGRKAQAELWGMVNPGSTPDYVPTPSATGAD